MIVCSHVLLCLVYSVLYVKQLARNLKCLCAKLVWSRQPVKGKSYCVVMWFTARWCDPQHDMVMWYTTLRSDVIHKTTWWCDPQHYMVMWSIPWPVICKYPHANTDLRADLYFMIDVQLLCVACFLKPFVSGDICLFIPTPCERRRVSGTTLSRMSTLFWKICNVAMCVSYVAR